MSYVVTMLWPGATHNNNEEKLSPINEQTHFILVLAVTRRPAATALISLYS